MYKDINFPPEEKSVDFEDGILDIDISHFQWLRPKELCEFPKLFCDNPENGHTLKQGSLGNCWLVSACFVLMQNKELLKRVFVDHDKDFFSKSYNGMWNFQLWDCNKNSWIKITIDDRLPTVNKKLMFGSDYCGVHFWFPLLEKACAKFYGCYAALHSGQASEAFMLLTSGYCWRRNLIESMCSGEIMILRQQIMKVIKHHESMAAIVSLEKHEASESLQEINKEIDSDSLVAFHYYVIVKLQANGDGILLELWNPWAALQNSLTPGHKTISMQKLLRLKPTITFCTTKMELLFDCRVLYQHSIQGSWSVGINSGGSYKSDLFSQNPQFVINLLANGPSLVYICLIQHNKRQYKKRKELEQAIAMHAWKLIAALKRPATDQSLKSNLPDFTTQPYQYKGNISLLCSVPPDKRNLLVIPSTLVRNISQKFLLKVCTSSPSSISVLQ